MKTNTDIKKLYVVDVFVNTDNSQRCTVKLLDERLHTTETTRMQGTRYLDGSQNYVILAAFIGSKRAASTFAKKVEACWTGFTY